LIRQDNVSEVGSPCAHIAPPPGLRCAAPDRVPQSIQDLVLNGAEALATPTEALEPADVGALILRIQGRDKQALEELYGLFSLRLKHYVKRFVRNDQCAEDVMHDVFLRIWRYAASFDASKVSKPESWIFQIARNQALTEAVLLSKSVSTDFSADDCPSGAHWMQQEQDGVNMIDKASTKSAAFERAIFLLPPTYRQAVYLRYNRELTHQQIADTLGVPVGTVKTWLRRALLQLRKQLHVRIESASLEKAEI